jgi:hypothetical protein
MTFNEILASLPNGLHDAELLRFEMDYVQRHLVFELVVWMGDMDTSHGRCRVEPVSSFLVDELEL